MKSNLSTVAVNSGYKLIQSVGDAKSSNRKNLFNRFSSKRIDNGRTVYAEKGSTREVWKDGQYIGQYQYAE